MIPGMSVSAIVSEILRGHVLPTDCVHGVVHWARVLENGLRLAEVTGADRAVVTLFALFHDARRVNDGHDDGHGLRGGELARSLRGTLVSLDDQQFEWLFEACRLHTDGFTEAHPTIQTCWDADRLDLGRVGIVPQRRLLCTEAARDLLPWAHARAIRDHEPAEVLASWGLRPAHLARASLWPPGRKGSSRGKPTP